MSQNLRPTFRSKFEELVYEDILHREISADYEPYKIEYTVPEKTRRYIPDFILKNGICIECKGWFPLKDRKKMIFVRSSNPTLDIRFIFMDADVKIRKGSKKTIGMWATDNEFMWARETIPQSWVNEKESTHKERTHRDVDHRLYLKGKYGDYSWV